ncbi:helix-turn-helix domain-containing protein [Streptomyces sp. NBC_00287]|uniref:helix-turn-helix domain-containing protein n=1 Tax=Streptomyces sp. NBC_00287 TaxID=2975702 RepID=UPI002E2E4A16|nr:helix-turn-helix domain-containing protein [Streptomyces sp. NBC_00287]
MRELVGRLNALDPDAGAAVRVIAYFDQLDESRAGLEALVRGAAVLSGCPARLDDASRRVHVRVEADGARADTSGPADPAWPSAPLTPGAAPAFWLERAGDASVVDAVVLERAAGAIRRVLDRTRGHAPVVPADDPAAVETVLDPTAPEQARLRAAGHLGLDTSDPAARACALAPLGGRPRVVPVSASGLPASADLSAGRLGIGPAVPVLDLPRSWAAARSALRFTAEGTLTDPGPSVVHAEALGDIALLADHIAPGSPPPPDARAVDSAAGDAPWMLATLHAVATSPSLRAAAAIAHVHHSTLHDRVARAEALLGWPLRNSEGRLRLHVALTTRRLARG